MENRIIDTGLADEKNYQILQSVLGQLSDGIWENSPRMEPYWVFASVKKEGVKVVIEIDGKSWSSYNNKPNVYLHMSDDEIKKFFAKKIKQIVFEEFGKENSRTFWKRDNENTVCDYLDRGAGVTVSDAYYAYDTLIGRNTDNKNYNTAVQSVFNTIMKDIIVEEVEDSEEQEQKYKYNESEFEEAWKKYVSDKSETKWVRRKWPLKDLKEVFREICKNVSKGNDLGAFKAWQKIATDGCLFRFVWKLGWNPRVPRSFGDNAPKFVRFKKRNKKVKKANS